MGLQFRQRPRRLLYAGGRAGGAAPRGPGSGFKCGAAHESDPHAIAATPMQAPDSLDSRAGTSKAVPRLQLLWPHLVQHMRVLIYNGDADFCVPYKGNEELVTNLETAGSLVEKAPRAAVVRREGLPEGAGGLRHDLRRARQDVPSKGPDASFLTIRLAGHMVPTFQPEAALAFIARFFRGEGQSAFIAATAPPN